MKSRNALKRTLTLGLRITGACVMMCLFATTDAEARKVKVDPSLPKKFTEGLDGPAIYRKETWRAKGPLGFTGYLPPAMGFKKAPEQEPEGGSDEESGDESNIGSDNEIQVDQVFENSPAHGKLQRKDIIVGIVEPKISGKIGTGIFEMDADKSLALAVTEAEKKNTPNRVVLRVFRPNTKTEMFQLSKKHKPQPRLVLSEPFGGEFIEDVVINLQPRGAFSETSPWNCEKSEALIGMHADWIVKDGLGDGYEDVIDALGLLATGEEKYIAVARDYARNKAKFCEKFDIMSDEKDAGNGTWWCAYNLLMLTEYHLLTGDREVLPGITALATYMAQGVSGVGTWSHGMAAVKLNGIYGPACAYGSMNQVSLVCGIGLLLSKKCGVENQYVNRALDLCLDFFKYYTDKGSIPYGEHSPREDSFDPNGRISVAAVLYDLAGLKREADFFTRLTLASHQNREGGHTGHYFGYLWGALGAARGGQEAAAAFSRSTRPYTELARRHDGSSHYQPMQSDNLKYDRWSDTGARLMQYCLPRKALHITGKSGTGASPLVGAELQTMLDAADFQPDPTYSVDQLKTALSHYLPMVRLAAAKELGMRNVDIVDEMIAVLSGSDNKYARYGALEALRCAGKESPKAFEAIFNVIETHEDWDLRFYAVKAFTRPNRYKGGNLLGTPPMQYADRLLKLATMKDEVNDSQGKLAAELAPVLFGENGVFARGRNIDKADRELRIAAIRSVIENPNGGARSVASSTYNHLPKEDIEELWGDIYQATIKPAPGGVMFSHGVRGSGIELMAKNHVKEGFDFAVWYTTELEGWGAYKRRNTSVHLAEYGQLAAGQIPWFESQAARDRKFASVIQKIKTTPAPELISIEKFIEEYEAEYPERVLDKKYRWWEK